MDCTKNQRREPPPPPPLRPLDTTTSRTWSSSTPRWSGVSSGERGSRLLLERSKRKRKKKRKSKLPRASSLPRALVRQRLLLFPRERGPQIRGRFSCPRCQAARLEIWTRYEPLVWQLFVRCLDRLRSTGSASFGRRLRGNVRVFSSLGSVRQWIHSLASVLELLGHYFHEPCAPGAHCSVSASPENYSLEMTSGNFWCIERCDWSDSGYRCCVSLGGWLDEFPTFL